MRQLLPSLQALLGCQTVPGPVPGELVQMQVLQQLVLKPPLPCTPGEAMGNATVDSWHTSKACGQ